MTPTPCIVIEPNQDIKIAEAEGQMIIQDLHAAFQAAVRKIEQTYDVKIRVVLP